jgi:uncharacterized protein YegL
VVAVLDVSLPMKGEKLELLTAAMEDVVELMGPADTLAIVVFNHAPRVLLDLTTTGERGKERARFCLRTLEASGSTNIGRGLGCAAVHCEGLASSLAPTVSKVLLLLTDGCDDRSPEACLAETVQFLARAGFSVLPFGLGAEHDAALLSRTAELSGTPYRFVARPGDLREEFKAAVKRASSASARRVSLRVHPTSPAVGIADIPEVFLTRERGGGAWEVFLTDFVTGETKRVLLPANISGEAGADGTALAVSGTLHYYDASDEEWAISLPVEADIIRQGGVAQPEPEGEHAALPMHRLRVETAAALRGLSSHRGGADPEDIRVFRDTLALLVPAQGGRDAELRRGITCAVETPEYAVTRSITTA